MTELDASTTNGMQVIAKISAIAGIVVAINITGIEPLYIWDLYISVSIFYLSCPSPAGDIH